MLPTLALGKSGDRGLAYRHAGRTAVLSTRHACRVPAAAAVSVAAGPGPLVRPPSRSSCKATTSELLSSVRVSWRNPTPSRRRCVSTSAAADPDAPPGSLPALRAALDAAVAREDYAEAARIRDRLSSLEADARTAVEDANARFYAAFRSGSAAAMADAWGTGDHVQAIHPGGGCVAGRAAVLESWRVVTGGIGLDIILRDVRIHAPPGSPVAVVTCLELVDVGDARGRNVATNVFEWQPDEDAVVGGGGGGGGGGPPVGGPGGGWKLVLHHASPAPRPQGGGGGGRRV